MTKKTVLADCSDMVEFAARSRCLKWQYLRYTDSDGMDDRC
jgi:hypothetical protein